MLENKKLLEKALPKIRGAPPLLGSFLEKSLTKNNSENQIALLLKYKPMNC